MKDFYYILGVEPDCSLDVIKEAYRKLSKKLHPDLNQGDAYFESRFRDIQEAFETLRDPDMRRVYDEQLNRYKTEKTVHDVRRRSYARASERPRPAYRAAQPAAHKIRKRGIGVGLTLALLAVFFIVGIYLVGAFATKKPVIYAPVKDTVSIKPVVHKRLPHHHLEDKAPIAAKYAKKHSDTTQNVVIQTPLTQPLAPAPEPVKPSQVKTEPLRPMIAKTWPDSSETHSDYLYTTFVHPNVTGIVQMRRQNRFDSNVIAMIPANAKVYVLERGNTYYRVFYNHNIGFVPKWALHQKRVEEVVVSCKGCRGFC